MSIWISRVGGIANVCSGLPRAAVGFAERRADREDRRRRRASSRWRRACPRCRSCRSASGWSSGNTPLRHQRRRDRHRHQLGQRLELVGRFRQQHAVAGEDRRRRRRLQQLRRIGNAVGGAPAGGRSSARRLDISCAGASMCCENTSIGTSSSTAPGRPVCARFSARGMTSARYFGIVDAPHALADRPVDVALRGIGVQPDALVRLARVVIRRRVAGDHHHRRASRRPRVATPVSALVSPGDRCTLSTASLCDTR